MRTSSLLCLALARGCASAFVGSPTFQSHGARRAAVATMEAATADKKQSFDTSIDTVPKCPETVWRAEGIDMGKELIARERVLPVEISAADKPAGMSDVEYFSTRREELLEQLTAGGAIWLRGFDLTKTKEGFATFYEQLQLEPCQDPLASVGARAVVDTKGAIYEAVNKPSRAKFFVGMHAESTYKRTNRLGAFVCFKPADTGGEFLLLDGHKMLRDMDPEVLSRLYERGVRFSNAELPFFDFLRKLPEPLAGLKEPLKGVFKGIAEVAVGAKIDMELELRWDENDEDGLRLLAFSPKQPPINRHPTTGEPSWFCNVHSHSRYLRDRRDGKLVESSGASKLNVTNMFYGDLGEISAEDLLHIDEVTMQNLIKVPMQQGDVVLVDNYQVMHGRDVFTGECLHAVTWFQ